MNREIVSRPTGLSVDPSQMEFDQRQVAALAQIGVKDASPGDLAVFLHVAQRTGLDPFARQIYMIGRPSKEFDRKTQRETWTTKYTIQTGIDGYRLIARRAADRAGEELSYEDTQWCGPDGSWSDCWLGQQPPAAAKVTIYRGNARYSAVALWKEFVQTDRNGNPNTMWSKMPANQLAKVAEVAVLRKAFPQDLSGVSADEEMPDHHDVIDAPPAIEAPTEPPPGALPPKASAGTTRVRRAVKPPPPEPKEPEIPIEAEVIPDPEPPPPTKDYEDVPLPGLGPEMEADSSQKPITSKQRERLMVLLRQNGIMTPEARMMYAKNLLGIEIDSYNQLTQQQASEMIDNQVAMLPDEEDAPPEEGDV